MFNSKKSLMKQKLLKTLALGLLLTGGVNGVWAGDFIDDATLIKVANTETSATSSEKKTLTFTPSSTEIYIEFTFSEKTVTPGQIFGVVEYSGTGTNTDKCRFRYLTLNNGEGVTELEEGNQANSVSKTVNGNTVMICSFLQNDNSNSGKVMKTYYKANVDKASLTLTRAGMYVGGTSGTSMTLKRVGIYTLGEILELYPDLKTNNWQINDAYRLLNDGSNNANNNANNNGTDNGWIETKNNGSDITTVAGCKLWVKAVDPAKLPSNYNYIYARRLNPSDATTEDIFENLKDNQVLMLSFGTGSNSHVMAKLPTMHKKLIDFDRNMFNYTFVDGIAPGSCEKVDVKGSQTTNYATYSRELKAGYNSCALPFKKIANASDVPAGITFYKVSTLSDDRIVFDKISDPTASNCFTTGTDWTPVIIHAETAGVYTFVGRDAITDWSSITYKSKKVGNSGEDSNCIYWVGSFVDGVPTGDYASSKNYGISSDGTKFLKMATDTKTTYYRAFIADKRTAGAPELTLSFDNGNGTTDIVQLKDVHGLTQEDGAVYNLQGVRMTGSNLPAGIYVKNGKKYVVK